MKNKELKMIEVHPRQADTGYQLPDGSGQLITNDKTQFSSFGAAIWLYRDSTTPRLNSETIFGIRVRSKMEIIVGIPVQKKRNMETADDFFPR